MRSMPVVPRGIVRAPSGTEFDGSGIAFPAFGDGGDIVAPCENAGDDAQENPDSQETFKHAHRHACGRLRGNFTLG